MSRMHNPAHLGEVLREWLPEGMTITKAAKELQSFTCHAFQSAER